MSLVPLIPNPPTGVAAFESFASKVFTTDPGYSPTSGISPFGKGIYSKYANGTRYHDTTGKTSFSKNNIICPIFAFGDNFANKNALMFNLHSESNRAATIDRLIAAFKAGNRNASTVTKLLQLVQDTNGLRPASLMMFPITPARDSSALVGFISIIQNWDTVIGKAIPSKARGIDFVLSDGVKTFTFTILSDGTVGLIGSGGDLHDSSFNSYRRTYFPFVNRGYSDYTIVFYPNASYFPYYLKVAPIIGCLAVMVLILLLACLFGSYNHYKDRQLQDKEDALDNKRLFVRFISHEIRTPLNTVCLGLRLLKDDAKATADSIGAVNSDAIIDLEEGLGAPVNESSALIPIQNITRASMVTLRNPTVDKRLLVGKLSGWVDIIKDIEESSGNAVEVLNELMSYDKIEMKTLKIEMELVGMWNFVNGTLKPFYVQAKEKCIQLTLKVDWDSITTASEEEKLLLLQRFNFIGDSVRLAQIFRNIVSNALKFSGPNTEVTVIVSWMPNNLLAEGKQICAGYISSHTGAFEIEAAGSIMVSVEDAGPGLSAENLRMLFKEGVQFNANKLQAGGGSGLGLYITKGLVLLHKGNILARSPGLGMGATFVLELPVMIGNPVVEIFDSSNLSRSKSINSDLHMEDVPDPIIVSHVLVVDDASLSRKMVCRILTSSGCTVSEAADGTECLSILEENSGNIDLVCMDYEMPIMKGPDATVEMRKRGFNTLVIGITGNVMQTDMDHFMNSGANAVLSKPLSFEKMLETVKSLNVTKMGNRML
eukprot:gene27234-35965_t